MSNTPQLLIALPVREAEQLLELFRGIEAADSHFHNCQSAIFRDFVRLTYKAQNVADAFERLRERMLHLWDAVEADFLRDYRISLVEQMDSMTWRQFLVLLNNLNPNGAVAVRIRAENEHPEADEKTDEEASNAFFSSIVSV